MESRARTVWEGDLMSGSGTTSLDSDATDALAVSWASRTEAHGGNTSPEELIAAAHASCYSMALSHELAQGGTPPERLETEAVVGFGQTDDGFRISGSSLTVRATVPGITEEDFQAAAQAAKDGCPVSQALKGNVQISLEATLS